MNEFSVEVEDLVKTFGNFVAVDHIHVQVKQRRSSGSSGQRGREVDDDRMLCGLLLPTSGSGRVAGFDLLKERRDQAGDRLHVPEILPLR